MQGTADAGPHFLANSLALDFINSAYGTGDEYHDCFHTDESVVLWLKAAGLLPDDFTQIPPGLAEKATELRRSAVQLTDCIRSGKAADTGILNHWLAHPGPLRRLAQDSETGKFILQEQRRDNSSESLLEPVVSSLVQLVTGSELQYMRQCEAHDCTLMFLDTTKSHRRRWCSMTLCGNRMKVAAFRSRRQGTS